MAAQPVALQVSGSRQCHNGGRIQRTAWWQTSRQGSSKQKPHSLQLQVHLPSLTGRYLMLPSRTVHCSHPLDQASDCAAMAML